MNENLEVIYDIWESISFASAGCACRRWAGNMTGIYNELIIVERPD